MVGLQVFADIIVIKQGYLAVFSAPSPAVSDDRQHNDCEITEDIRLLGSALLGNEA